MQLLSDFLMSLTNLIEAEGRVLRRGVVQVMVALAIIVVCMTFLLTGTALLVLGTYCSLLSSFGQVPAAFLSGIAAWILALILILMAKSVAS